jgi:cystathionine beta-lyase/cystathionine gamma-synthase
MNDEALQNLHPKTLLWLESPQNPRGEVVDLQHLKSLIPAGVIIAVDCSFAPPPIQNLLDHGNEAFLQRC